MTYTSNEKVKIIEILNDSLEHILLKENLKDIERDFLIKVNNLYRAIKYSDEDIKELPTYEICMKYIEFKLRYDRIKNNEDIIKKLFLESPELYSILESNNIALNKGKIKDNYYNLNIDGSWVLDIDYKFKIEDFRKEKDSYILKISKEYRNSKEEIYVINNELFNKKIIKRRISF